MTYNYDIKAAFNLDQIELITEFRAGDKVLDVQRQIFNLREQTIKDALVKLGWTPPGEALTAEQWRRDAEDWGDALNAAGWLFLDECPERSTKLFNTAKPALRAAILAYSERVHAKHHRSRVLGQNNEGDTKGGIN